MLEIAPTASMAVVTLAGRAMLSAVFLTACVAKLVDRSGSRRSLIEFGFPSSAVPPLSIGVPIAELMVAAALLPVASVRAGAAAALLLLAAFSITIATALARGRHVECRCFGQLTSGIVSWRTLARNAVLAVVALAVLLAYLGSPPPSLFDAVSTLRGAVLVAWTVGLAAVAIIGLGAWAFVISCVHTAGFSYAWSIWSSNWSMPVWRTPSGILQERPRGCLPAARSRS